MNSGFLTFAVLFLLCLAIRCGYELLKESGRIDTERRPVFIAIVAAMCVLWISWFSLCRADPYRMDLPGAVRWAGFAVFLAGMALAVGALIQLRGVENIKHMVTAGLFRKIRHPMYTGFILWIFGWSVYHGALLSLAIGLFGVAATLWWRHLEDRRLEVQFGSGYRNYRLTTWF